MIDMRKEMKNITLQKPLETHLELQNANMFENLDEEFEEPAHLKDEESFEKEDSQRDMDKENKEISTESMDKVKVNLSHSIPNTSTIGERWTMLTSSTLPSASTI